MATFTVTTTEDIIDAGDGLLSLREAVAAANDSAEADTIVFFTERYRWRNTDDHHR